MATTTDSADYTAITRLQAVYGDAVTRQAWDELKPQVCPTARFGSICGVAR